MNPPSSGKGPFVVLAVSVTLNAFLLGFIASSYGTRPFMPFEGREEAFRGPPPPHGPEGMGFDGGPHEHGGPMGGPLEMAAEDLPEAYRADVLKLLQESRAKGEDSMEQMHRLMDQVGPLLQAQPFDAEKVSTVFKAMDEADLKVKETFSETLLEIAKRLPDEERRAFFSHMRPPHEDRGENKDHQGRKKSDGISLPPR